MPLTFNEDATGANELPKPTHTVYTPHLPSFAMTSLQLDRRVISVANLVSVSVLVVSAYAQSSKSATIGNTVAAAAL